MIVRVWRGQAPVASADAYERHVTQQVFPGLAGIRGYHGAEVLRRETSDGIEFIVMTYWESLEAIQKFAGPRAETAVVTPEARALLSNFEAFARHYTLAQDSTRKR